MIKNPRIKYVSKEKLYPAFGYAYVKEQEVHIRKDLPMTVQKFVLAHEIYHLKDLEKIYKNNQKYNWVWREIKANMYGGFKHPIGFIFTLLMSLQPYRLMFYLKRFRERK